MKMSVRMDGAQELLNAIEKSQDMMAFEEAVKLTMSYLFRVSSANTPYRFGFLNRSEQVSGSGLEMEVGYIAKYAPYVEFGTRWMYGRRYLLKAMQQTQPFFYRNIEKAMLYTLGGK